MNEPLPPIRSAAPDARAGVPTAATEVAPADVGELAERVRRANADGLTIAFGGTAVGANLILSLRHLSTPIDHCAGDLVATVPAGASLAAVNTVLNRGGQWLPLDPPDLNRSIGAMVATNDSGPPRHRHGTPRDLILGVEMVLADGRIAKAGGRVVKNVAGYDLARLLCGSCGSLAIITSATFKLAPVPPASRTAIVNLQDTSELGALTRAIASAPLTPSALELDAPPCRLLVRFESTAAAADRQAATVADLCSQQHAQCAIVANQEETQLWTAVADRTWRVPGTRLNVHVLPTDVPAMLDELARSATRHAVEWNAGGRAALGVIHARLAGQGEHHAAIIADLRTKARARGGSLIVRSTDPSADPRLDRWGEIGDALPIMRAVKARFDPKGTLNPGAAPGGL